jgi:hypothetical protein
MKFGDLNIFIVQSYYPNKSDKLIAKDNYTKLPVQAI